MSVELLIGDCRTVLPTLPAESVHCVVTSPPYWKLRDYGVDGQIGLEPTVEEYVDALVDVFRAVRRVLRTDGVVWLNMGDTYNGSGLYGGPADPATRMPRDQARGRVKAGGLKPKDLIGLPWMLAFALRADGWWLRSEVIWHKPNPKPESIDDRPTKAHEQLFLLAKSERYFYDHAGYLEPTVSLDPTHTSYRPKSERIAEEGREVTLGAKNEKSARAYDPAGRNARSVWTLTCERYLDAHFATMPSKLAMRCIQLGTSEHGCCPACGTPWERVTTSTRSFESGSGRSGRDPVGKHGAALEGGGETRDLRRGPVVTLRTIGWKPTCPCEEMGRIEPAVAKYGPVPCTILDPFGGSGTTGEAALALGRRAILVELNPDYGAMAVRRTAQGGLLAWRTP